jgi:hypothetical protein
MHPGGPVIPGGPAPAGPHRGEPSRTAPAGPHSAEAATGSRRAGRDSGEEIPFAPAGYLPDQSQRLRLTALVGLILVLLVALPLFLLIHDSAKDPVISNLNSLSLPKWAAVGYQDQSSGSRWCIQTCRWRERTWRSTKATADTDQAYRSALSGAGWSPLTTDCPAAPGAGKYSCWQREQDRLDLWTRDAACGLAGLAPSPGASAPSAAPSPSGPDVLPLPVPSASGPPPTCPGSLVTAKVAPVTDPHWQDQ